ncbi:hypothetical protein D3C71_1832950 [compost metagenome]
MQSTLLAADIPEALAPVSGRWRVAVLCAKSQRSDRSVQQVALVGVVAIDAQALATQRVERVIQVRLRRWQHQVEVGLAGPADDDKHPAVERQVLGDIRDRFDSGFAQVVFLIGHMNSSPAVHRQAGR